MSDEAEPQGGETAESRPQWRAVPASFWLSLQGERAAATDHVEHDAVADWVITQDGVAIDSHGGFAPEHWTGEVDGHRFSFRERHSQWAIEIDHQPSGRFVQQVTSTQPDGTAIYHTRELEIGVLIASGTTDAAGYGTTAVARAQFIIETIRTHLAQQSCTHYLDKLEGIDILLGITARWCPHCGVRLPDR